MAGRFTLARRLAEAQAASEEAAQVALIAAGRALARRDRAGFVAACFEVAAHYRNAGNATLAAHWQRRGDAHKAG